jgi:excisionase family DNA binding protein
MPHPKQSKRPNPNKPHRTRCDSPTDPNSLFITRTHAAKLCDCNVQTLDKRIADGTLKKYRFGRLVLVKRAELLHHIESEAVADEMRRKGSHVQHHVNPGIVNAACKYCTARTPPPNSHDPHKIESFTSPTPRHDDPALPGRAVAPRRPSSPPSSAGPAPGTRSRVAVSGETEGGEK